MNQAPLSIAELVIRRIRHELNGWMQALEQGASALGDYSARASNELAHSRLVWKQSLEEIEGILAKADELSFAQIDRLLELLPPERSILRYHLERLTLIYEEVCLAARGEIADTFRQAEVAIDRGDFEIGLNILDHLLKQDPRFFPALMLKAVTLMRSDRGREDSIRLLDRAIQAAPPKAGDRYKVLAMELLATTCQLADSPQMAIKTLRRTRAVGFDDPAIDYLIARNHAVIGQAGDAITALDQAIRVQPKLLALALVDRDFTSVRRDIVQKMEEMNEYWGERTIERLKESRRIVRFASDLKLDQREKAVAKGKHALDEMDKQLEQGCYSLYRDILGNKLVHWLKTVPPAIEKSLGEISQERLDQVQEHNAQAMKVFQKRRSTFLKVGIPLWSVFSALVFLISASNGSGMLASSLSAGVTLLIGALPFFVVNTFLRRSYEESRITLDHVPNVRAEVNQIKDLRKTIVSGLSKDGIDVSGL